MAPKDSENEEMSDEEVAAFEELLRTQNEEAIREGRAILPDPEFVRKVGDMLETLENLPDANRMGNARNN